MWGFSAFCEGSVWLNLDYVNLSTLFCACWCEALNQYILFTKPEWQTTENLLTLTFCTKFLHKLNLLSWKIQMIWRRFERLIDVLGGSVFCVCVTRYMETNTISNYWLQNTSFYSMNNFSFFRAFGVSSAILLYS